MSDLQRPQRVGLFGRLGSGNLGNDATLEAVLAYLAATQPDAALDSLCSGPEAVTARYGMPASQLHWLHDRQAPRSRLGRALLTVPRIALGALVDTWRTAAWTRRQDVVIVPGMGVLESTVPQRPWQMPYSMAVLSIAGRLFGTKVAFVGVGASVVRQRATRALMRLGARLAHYRSFRDDESLEAARLNGFAAAHDRVYPDLVFALPARPAAQRPAGLVGVGVMAYYGNADDQARSDELHTEYLAKMQRLVGWLVANGYDVQLFASDDADEAEVPGLLTQAGADRIRYERCDTFDDLMREAAGVDVMIGTRFHNVIAALKCGTPTIAIGYGRKHDAVMRMLGQAEYAHDIHDFDVELVIEQFMLLTHDRERIAGELSARNSQVQRALDEQFDAVSADVFASPQVRVGTVST